MKKRIDKNYFKNYGGECVRYDDSYHEYSAVDDCIVLFNKDGAPYLKKILVFGAATGKVCEDFYNAFNILPYGCEINEWAYGHIPVKFRKRVQNEDMRLYTSSLVKNNEIFDLGFSNSFQYLEEDSIPDLFKSIAQTCRHLHFHTSFTGNAARDPYRKTLKPYKWWNNKLIDAGFTEMRDLWDNKVYIWKSTLL